MTQKQIELEQELKQMLAEAHREQDLSHEETMRGYKEIMEMCDKAVEGLSHEKKTSSP